VGELEHILTTTPATSERLRPRPDLPGSYWLDPPTGTVAVTLSRTVLDANSPGVRLLTYLTPELDELLNAAAVTVPALVAGELPPGPVAEVARTLSIARRA